MPIRMNCPACDRQYTLADTMRGKHVNCKNCAEPFTVVDKDGSRDSAISRDLGHSSRSASLRGRRSRSDEDDEIRSRSRDFDEEDFEEEDRRPSKKKKSSGAGVLIGLSVGMVCLLVVVGVVLAFTLGGSGGSWFAGDKFTLANARKLKIGMTEAEVINTIGPPTETKELGSGIRMLTYRRDKKNTTEIQLTAYNFTLRNGVIDQDPTAFLPGSSPSGRRPVNPGNSLPFQPGNPFAGQPGQPVSPFPGQPARPGTPFPGPPGNPSQPVVPIQPGQGINPGPPGNPGGPPQAGQPFPPVRPSGPVQPPGKNPVAGQPTKDIRNLRPGMPEAELLTVFGKAAAEKNLDGTDVTQAHVTVDEVTGPDGKTKPVKLLTFTKDNGQPGFLDITLVDGKVYKYLIR